MYEFDTLELRALISGRFRFTKCIECDGLGNVLVDHAIGEVVRFVDPSRTDDFYRDCCDFCNGLGGKLELHK